MRELLQPHKGYAAIADSEACMAHRVCPAWLGYCLTCPLRRWWQDPTEIVGPYVHEGQVVLEPGPGMGYFTLDLARLVGTSGRVVAVDIQPKMLERLRTRAAKAGVAGRIETRMASAESMGIRELGRIVDFTLAFAVVHEFPDQARFFREVAEVSKPGSMLLLVEPRGHVEEPMFGSELEDAGHAGFTPVSRPKIRGSHAAVLKKSE
jgi:ubiquinone/menaquinone biosynthesis C-methylase UbiE